MSKPVNLLILSDSAAGVTGLGRIARELALRIHENLSDVFRVGVAGVGGNYSSRLPFPNYPITQLQGMIPHDLSKIWRDFAGDEKGILLSIWNISWLQWLAEPERLPPGLPIREFLGVTVEKPSHLSDESWNKLPLQMKKLVGKVDKGPFEKWLYCPVDGHLPNGTLGTDVAPILAGFDRVLAYTGYGSEVIAKTMGVQRETIPNLPHGTDTKVFYPRNRDKSRKTFIHRLSQGKSELPITDDVILLAAVATNSYRKDWGLAFQTCQELLLRGKNVFIWCHTNCLEENQGPQAYWNLLSLARNFGMANRVVLTTHALSDDDMAWCLSAVDVNLCIGSGEGWGMGCSDSLAVGVPVVHGNYAGSTDFIPRNFLVDPKGYRLEGRWMIQRPCFDPSDWADTVEYCLTPEGKSWARLPEYIDWDNAWFEWKRWLLDGVQASA